MRRMFRAFSLIVLAAYLSGCSGDTVNDATPPSADTAKAAAAKMPPPPDPKAKTP